MGDADVTDVASAAGEAALGVTVQDDAGPDARTHLDEQQARDVREAAARLAETHQIRVVVDDDRNVEPVLKRLRHRVVVPAGHQRRLIRPAGSEVGPARQPDPDALQLSEGAPALAEQSSKPVAHGVEHRLRPGIDEHLLGRLGEHLTAGILEREPAVGGAEVSEEDQLVGLVEGQDSGRPAGSAGAGAGLSQAPPRP